MYGDDLHAERRLAFSFKANSCLPGLPSSCLRFNMASRLTDKCYGERPLSNKAVIDSRDPVMFVLKTELIRQIPCLRSV